MTTMQLRCCSASGCRSAGAAALQQALLQARDQLGGTAEAVEIKSVGCLRLCGRGPLVALDHQDARPSALYAGLRPEQAADLLRLAADFPHQEGSSLRGQRLDLDHPFFALQQSVVLASCGRIDPESIGKIFKNVIFLMPLHEIFESFRLFAPTAGRKCDFRIFLFKNHKN